MPVKKSKSVGKKPAARPSRRRAPVAELAPAVWDEDIRGDRGLDTADRIEARPVMLLVVGPHRSGTSVAARALECLGAVNSLNLMPANEANPKGYFEDNDIYLFNERVLLPALGRAWYSTCPVDWTVLSHAERSRLGLQALEIVRRNYPLGNAVSVLKEPRISALLPFWLSVLQHAGFAVRLVGAVRDPLSVARSLRQRDGFSLTHGGMLYLTTWVSILQQAGETALALLSFEDLLANPSKALRRAADRLQLLLPADFEARAANFAAGHVDRDLCHSIVDPNDVSLEPDLPPAVTELFAGLREAVSSQNARKAGKAVAAAERLVHAMLPALGDFDRVFWERLQERQTSRGASEQLQQQVQAYQARVQELEQSSSALQHQLQSASAPQELANLRTQAEALQVTASEKSARLEALTVELAARDAQLQELLKASQQREAEYSELVTRYQQLEATHSELAARHHLVFTSEQSLMGRLTALEVQNQEVAARQAVADDERQRLAAERDNLAAQLESLRLEHSDLVTRHTPLVTSYEDLTIRYQQLETAYAELTARHTALVTSGSDLSARLDALEAQRQEAVARCATSIEEQQRVLAERDQLAAELESLRSQNSELATRHQSLATTHEDLVTAHESLDTTHEDLVTRHTSLVTAHESLDTAHAKLIARHAALEAERSELVVRRQLLASNLQSFEDKHSSSAKEVAELRSRCERAEQQRKEATARAQSAERDLRKRDREIEHLQSLLEPLEKVKDEHEQLEAKIALLAAAREKLVSEKDDLTSRLTRAESERRNLQQNVDERFEELSKLTRQIISLEHEVAAQRTASLGIITDKQSLEEEVRALQRSVDERFREIAQLQEKLLTAQKSQRELSEDMRTIMSSRSWRLTGPVRRITQTVPRVEQEAQTKSVDFKRSYRTIQNSGLFDADYYLKNNPDISAKKVDPIKHYLLHGAREGRNPSPNFSTRDYLRRHPVLETDPFAPNPLVHFILSQAKAS